MEIEIVTRDFPPTEAIIEHVRAKWLTVLVWDTQEIESVRVTLGGNGVRARGDKYCRVHVKMVGGPDLTYEHVSRDLYEAVSRASSRAAQALRDELSRRRRTRRSKGLGVMWA